MVAFPNLSMLLMVNENVKTKECPLEHVLNAPFHENHVSTWLDKYRGPVSAKAQSLLRTIALSDTSFRLVLIFSLVPPQAIESRDQPKHQKDRDELSKNQARFVDFYTRLKERHSLRVEEF